VLPIGVFCPRQTMLKTDPVSWVFPLVFLATKRGLLSQIASRCFQSCSAIVGNSLYSLSKSDLFAFHLLQPCHCIKPNKFPVQNSFSGYRRRCAAFEHTEAQIYRETVPMSLFGASTPCLPNTTTAASRSSPTAYYRSGTGHDWP